MVSKPKYKWWTYARNMIYDYPSLCRAHNESLRQKVTASYSGQPGGVEASRTTENTAVNTMSRNDYLEYDAVHSAIAQTKESANGAAKINMIRLMYWARTHTLQGAAQAIHVSYATARRWHVAFVRKVGENYGFFR